MKIQSAVPGFVTATSLVNVFPRVIVIYSISNHFYEPLLIMIIKQITGVSRYYRAFNNDYLMGS